MITNKALNQFCRFIFIYVYVEVESAMCVQVPNEARRGNQMPFTSSCRQRWTAWPSARNWTCPMEEQHKLLTNKPFLQHQEFIFLMSESLWTINGHYYLSKLSINLPSRNEKGSWDKKEENWIPMELGANQLLRATDTQHSEVVTISHWQFSYSCLLMVTH